MTNYITKTIKNGVEANIPVTSVNGQYGDVVVAGNEYHAGPGISIGTYNDYSAMRGPAPSGFHVGTLPEWEAINNDGQTMGAWNAQHNNMSVYLKMPGCGMLNSSTGSKYGTYKYYWTSSVLTGDYAAYSPYIDVSAGYNLDGTSGRGAGYPIRPIKDKPVIPDNSWTIIYQGTGSAGIFHNATLGLISLSKDGTTRYTLADKNLGATTVWNNGDTVSQDNGGNFYQRGNNYGFPFTGATTTSSTTVDASTYGPGNYYNSSTFIKSSSWDSSNNTNLRGVVTGVVTINDAITNTGVLSVNGQTGNVTTATVMTESEYSQVSDPVAGKIYFIKES